MKRRSRTNSGLLHSPSGSRRTFLWRGLLAGVVVFVALSGMWGLGPLQSLEWMSLDARFVARFLLSTSERALPVTVVAIDDASVRQYGRWPWDRSTQARLIAEVLRARPRVLGIDIVYSEPAPNPRDDGLLAESLASPTPVVLAAARSEGGELFPRDTLLSENVRIGHINSGPDADGVVRRLRFRILTSRGFVDTLGWVMAHAVDPSLEAPPLEPDGRLYINYRPQSDSPVLSVSSIAKTVSAADVLAGEGTADLAGQAVLIGVTAPGLESLDEHLTPLRPLGQIPGVYIHAAALSSFLEHDYLDVQKGLGVYAFLGFVSLAFGAACFLLRPWPATAAAVSGLGAFSAYAVWQFVSFGRWVIFVPAALAVILQYVAGLWHAHAVVDREGKRVAREFRRYVASEVVERLLSDPAVAELEGGRRTITVMFADIRGFTRFSENTAPEEVVRVLNRYLALMTESVLLHGGMLDKFLGDGILAIFGAPVPREDHADAAVRAGLHLLRQIEAARTSLARQELSVSVGIHTGEAVVGAVGSTERREYTAIGDAVNVAARLQELAQPGTILSSEETVRRIAARLDARVEEASQVELRGRMEPVLARRLIPSALDPSADLNDNINSGGTSGDAGGIVDDAAANGDGGHRV